uniref:Vitamin K epoxide reductase n=1 Tax=Cyanothece sp. (strain PCC 7425 / ATCC 29141) TaxID=395961 RepID=B8HRX1_CYAP4
MSRRRSIPWIHRWSRPLIGGTALMGASVTAYLTISHQLGKGVACPTEGGCDVVLSSPYASVFGLPLSLFGFLAYVGMAVLALAPLLLNPVEKKELRQKLENLTWLLLFAGAIAMVIFSGYLMFLLATEIQQTCPYCIASACFTVLMLVLTIVGRDWTDRGNLFFIAIVVGMITLIGTLGLYASSNPNAGTPNDKFQGAPISTQSGPAELALAEHLKQKDIKMYGAWWCSHCHDQKELFGASAFKQVPYVECSPEGGPGTPPAQICLDKGVQSYPTWDVNGQIISGTRPLEELARLSDYQGPKNFQNTIQR